MIVHSSYKMGITQADGRTPVYETHISDDGQKFHFEYLDDNLIDKDATLSLRAARVDKEITMRKNAMAEANNGSTSFTKQQFRNRFTKAEKALIDPFNKGGYLTNPVLSQAQKDAITISMEDYMASDEIRLDHPDVITIVSLYESLGFITSERKSEILNG